MRNVLRLRLTAASIAAKDPKKPDLMCRCKNVRPTKRGYHRYRDCKNARCSHLKRDGSKRFRKGCWRCSPDKFCAVCISTVTNDTCILLLI